MGADGPQVPSASAQLRPMHKPPMASAGLSILGREGTSGGPPLGERTTVGGSTTARLRVVVLPDGSRALSEGETLQQAHALLVALKLETAKGSATPCLRHP